MGNADNIIDVTDGSFEFDVINQSFDTPVVVDFWAPWCGPCRMLSPILESLADDPDLDFILAKVNVDENPNVAMRYQVQGIPAVKAFVNGQIAAEFTGAQPEPRVREFLEKLLPDEFDEALNQAAGLLAIHQWSEAEDILSDLLDARPGSQRAQYQMARALLGQAYGCDALPHLKAVTDGPEFVSAARLKVLADYLCRIETAGEIDEELPPLEALYNRSAILLQRGNLEAALDGLLDVLRQDKRYRNGEAREVMLAIFELLGDGDDLTQAYRNELAMVLF
ncbi:MAG: tetratricopeptide repeat protein [Chloroflexota bacterium]